MLFKCKTCHEYTLCEGLQENISQSQAIPSKEDQWQVVKKMSSKQQTNSNTLHLAPSSLAQMAYIGPKQSTIKNQATPVMPKPTSTTPLQGSFVSSIIKKQV